MIKYHKQILESPDQHFLQCKPVAVIQIDEYEDEGTYYIFDIGEGWLLIFGGQDNPPSKAFPNSDFEFNEHGTVLKGRRLEPVSIVPGKKARNLMKPPIPITFPGNLSSAIIDYMQFVDNNNVENLYKENYIC